MWYCDTCQTTTLAYFQEIMSSCNCPSISEQSESKTTCCDCPSQAEIDEFMNMPKEVRMKYLRDILLPPKITFTECQRCVVVEATHTTASEYVQRIPIDHRTNQQKVNTELWEQWNIADHERAMEAPYEFEKDIYSEGVERLRDPNIPPSLSLCYSICSRRWGQEQKHYLYARIGEIIFAKNGTGVWDTSGIIITYALERVDEPRRWNKYKVSHLASENFDDVIRAHNANGAVDN
jgi:hypothetical protein